MQVRRTPSSRYYPSSTQPQQNERVQLSPKTNQQPRQQTLQTEPSSNSRSPLGQHSRMRSNVENTPAGNQRDTSFSFQRDQNKLCFSNLKHSIKPSQARNCELHPNKKAKYKDKQWQKLYCFHCAIQVASQGYQLEQLEQTETNEDCSERELVALVEDCCRRILESKGHIELEYRACKTSLLKDMEAHRNYYDMIIERVNEMRNRDVSFFQEALQQAQKEFSVVIDDLTKNCYNVLAGMNRAQLPKDEVTRLCTKSLQKAESLSNYKFTLVKQDAKLNQRLEDLERLLLSLRLNVRNASTSGSVLSQILKSNSTFCSDKQRKERDEKQKSVEDTPESIKNKMSVCKSIVDPKEVRMLGQIDFCESLVAGPSENINSNVGVSGTASNQSASTTKARSRYNITEEH